MVQTFDPTERSRKLEEILKSWDRILEENDRKMKEIKDYDRLSSSI